MRVDDLQALQNLQLFERLLRTVCDRLTLYTVYAHIITTIFPRIYARMYEAQPRARVMSFSVNSLFCL
jgi:hypothetical protein